MRRLVRVLGSVRFFLVVTALLVVGVVVAAAVPQGHDDSFYAGLLGEPLWTIARLFGFHRFFESLVFFVPAALMEASLLACTLPRLFRRLRALRDPSAGRRASPGLVGRRGVAAWAPDLIHLGLAILIAAGAVGAATRRDWVYRGPVGGELVVQDQAVRLTGARELRGPGEGSPLVGWQLQLELGGRKLEAASNAPASSPVGRIHFLDYAPTLNLVVADGDGGRYTIAPGEGMQYESGEAVILVSVEEEAAVFALLQSVPDDPTAFSAALAEAPVVLRQPGEAVGPFTLVGTEPTVVVTFSVTRDPATPAIVVGMVLMTAGFLLFLYRRLAGGAARVAGFRDPEDGQIDGGET